MAVRMLRCPEVPSSKFLFLHFEMRTNLLDRLLVARILCGNLNNASSFAETEVVFRRPLIETHRFPAAPLEFRHVVLVIRIVSLGAKRKRRKALGQ